MCIPKIFLSYYKEYSLVILYSNWNLTNINKICVLSGFRIDYFRKLSFEKSNNIASGKLNSPKNHFFVEDSTISYLLKDGNRNIKLKGQKLNHVLKLMKIFLRSNLKIQKAFRHKIKKDRKYSLKMQRSS